MCKVDNAQIDLPSLVSLALTLCHRADEEIFAVRSTQPPSFVVEGRVPYALPILGIYPRNLGLAHCPVRSRMGRVLCRIHFGRSGYSRGAVATSGGRIVDGGGDRGRFPCVLRYISE